MAPEGADHCEPSDSENQPAPGVMQSCPVVATQEVFGKKWTFAILRDVVYFGRSRFHEFLAANPGLSDRILAQRLKELTGEGVLVRTGFGKFVQYKLTDRGEDVKPMLVALFNYGVRHRAYEVFEDRKPRALTDVEPSWDAQYVADIFRLHEAPAQLEKGEGVGA